MDPNLDALTRELTALTWRFADLGAKLGDAARALEEAGTPPADTLVADLAGARSTFIQLRTDVLTAAEAASVPPRGEPESLTELEPLLAAIETAIRMREQTAKLEQARHAVLTMLDRVLDIVHRDDRDFAPLVGVHGKARALRDSVMAVTDPESADAKRLASSAQPFTDFLSMVQNRDAVDDERYAELEESVSKAFGRGLAVAVSRGRLAFAEDIVEPPAPEPVLAEAEPAVAEPEPVLAEPEALMAGAPPDMPPVLAPPAVEEPAVELTIEAPPVPPPPATVPVEAPLRRPEIEMPRLDLEPREPVAAPSAPESQSVPAVAPPPSQPARRPTAAEPSAPDETAQWWLAAWARWSGWKATHQFADMVKEEVGKYPYLLSVPIQKSPEYEDGLLAYGYSILMDHVERQKPGCVGNALSSLQPAATRPVGDQLYEYLVNEGRLRESYPDFVKNALLAAVPDPGLWFQFRILESKEDTRIFQRASARLGDTELSGQRLASDNQRYAEHKFKMTLPPLTLRCVQISADSIRESRGVGVKILSDGTPSDSGWMTGVPVGARGKIDAKRVVEDGTHLTGVGKDFVAVWVVVFNPDPDADRRYELSVFLRKDSKSPFRR
jgi:hypothetical protein